MLQVLKMSVLSSFGAIIYHMQKLNFYKQVHFWIFVSDLVNYGWLDKGGSKILGKKSSKENCFMWSQGFQIKDLGHFRFNNSRSIASKNALSLSKFITWCQMGKFGAFYWRWTEENWIENALNLWFEMLEIIWNIFPSKIFCLKPWTPRIQRDLSSFSFISRQLSLI